MLQIITPQRPVLTAESFLKRYKTERRRKKMAPYYQAIIAEVDKLSDPIAIYQEFPLERLAELATWTRPYTCAITLGLCTLGAELETWSQELVHDDLLSAVILEEITLAWIVAITREIHSIIRRAGQERGLIVGPAYRPGVGRWPLETQNIVFAHLPANEIGVTLNEYLQMSPRKSTSLIMPMRKPVSTAENSA
jgi:hypothetical protein